MRSPVRRIADAFAAVLVIFMVAAPAAPAAEGGYALWDSSYIERQDYTVRLVANGQNIEALRPMLESAAAEVHAVNGVQLTVAPGTIFERQPLRGEVVVTIGPTNQCGLDDVACATPLIIDERPTEEKDVIQASKIWIKLPEEFFGYTPEQQRFVVAHEFGHAMGLQHYDQPFVDGMQVMSTKFTSPNYKAGDRNGFRYLAPRPGEFWSLSVAARASDRLLMACPSRKYGVWAVCKQLWPSNAGTDVSVSTLGDGSAAIAFNGAGELLNQCRVDNQWGASCWSSGVPIAPGTSPAVATLSGGAASGTAIAAFNSAGGALGFCQLTSTGPANCASTGWVMAAGSSPSIVPLSDGSATVVFRGAGGEASRCRVTYSRGSNCTSSKVPMTAGTSAGVAQLSTGEAAGSAVTAFRTPTGALETCQLTPSGFANCANQGWVLAAGTSPTVAPLSDGSVAVGFNGGGGQFSQCRVTWFGGSNCSASSAPMAAGASPGSSLLAGGTAIAAFRRASGTLGTCQMTASGPTSCADQGWSVAAGTTPSVSPFREGSAAVTFTGGSGTLSACRVTLPGGSNCWVVAGSPGINIGTSANPKATALPPAA